MRVTVALVMMGDAALGEFSGERGCLRAAVPCGEYAVLRMIGVTLHPAEFHMGGIRRRRLLRRR